MSTYSTENNQPELEVVRSFIAEYFDAWKGTNENQILAYASGSSQSAAVPSTPQPPPAS